MAIFEGDNHIQHQYSFTFYLTLTMVEMAFGGKFESRYANLSANNCIT